MDIKGLSALADDIELPHDPSNDPQWQESLVLGWADPKHEVGGFVRIGHQPNLGLTRSCFGVTSRNGLNYTRTAEGLPLREGDRTRDTFFADGFQSVRFDGRKNHWLAEDENVQLDIEVVDAHGPYDFWDMTGSRNETSEIMAANHLQVGGTFSGKVKIGQDPAMTVSGFTYRDHSWGPRYMDNPHADMASGWWLVGALGDDFTFGFGGARMRSGIHSSYAYLIKDGVLDIVEIEDAAVLMAFDGLSNRGGQVTVNSTKFGQLTFHAEGYGNVWLELGQKHFEMAMPCTVRCGDRIGGGLIDTILNPRNGTDRPQFIESGALHNGLYHSRNGMNVA